MVAHGVDWSSISPQLLSSIFELQSNALDNCAAACACAQWRQAVSESHIAHLHLHADSPSYNSNWRSFFKSRRSIASLKLTSDIRQRFKTWAPLLAKSVEQGCCLKQIPLGCSALSVSHDFLGVPGCISHLVGLQDLKFTYNPQMVNAHVEPSMITYEKGPLPDLMFLDHLKKLELHQEDYAADSQADHYFMPGKVLPVEHLVLNKITCYPPVLDKLFTVLTHLELIHCHVYDLSRVVAGSVRSLNLEGSQLEDDGKRISDWTQLTSLRLTNSTWQQGMYRPVPPSEAFYGWPCLRTLHCSGCNLFDDCIDLQLGPGLQLELDWVEPGIECAELSLVATDVQDDFAVDPRPDISVNIENALQASCLVRLELYLGEPPPDAYALLASNMCSWLEACPQLQVLSLSAPSISASYPIPAVFAPSNAHTACLREVQLHNLPIGVLDLEKAYSLSVLKLTVDRTNVLCKLCLPSSLQHFEFGGNFLFAAHGRSALCDCSMMTKLILSPLGLKFPVQTAGIEYERLPSSGLAYDQITCTEYGMPILPSSLAHLTFDWGEQCLTTLVGSPSLTCLQACTNLERLTIPRQYYQSGLLREFANTARHLHVFEYCWS